jgi:lysozyme family protein
MNYTCNDLSGEYSKCWNNMQIVRTAEMTHAADKILAGKDRYIAISRLTDVPWWFIGVLHLRESDCDFNTHLHNGDPLTARTVNKPAGRPRIGKAPFTWDTSAVDALKLEGFDGQTDWSLQQTAYRAEQYNGFGYRMRGVPSAYLWAGTNQYSSGKFVADKVFDRTAVDPQPGVMGVIKELQLKDPSVMFTTEVAVVVPVISPKAEIPRPTGEQMNQVSRKYYWHSIMQWTTGIFGTGTVGLKALDMSQVEQARSQMDVVKTFVMEYGAFAFIGVCVLLIVFCIYQKSLMKSDVQEGRATPSGAAHA